MPIWMPATRPIDKELCMGVSLAPPAYDPRDGADATRALRSGSERRSSRCVAPCHGVVGGLMNSYCSLLARRQPDDQLRPPEQSFHRDRDGSVRQDAGRHLALNLGVDRVSWHPL